MKKIWSIDCDNDNDLKGLLDYSSIISGITAKEYKTKMMNIGAYGFDMPSNIDYDKQYNWLVYESNNVFYILAIYEKD